MAFGCGKCSVFMHANAPDVIVAEVTFGDVIVAEVTFGDVIVAEVTVAELNVCTLTAAEESGLCGLLDGLEGAIIDLGTTSGLNGKIPHALNPLTTLCDVIAI